jgi:hypothetical protein
VAAVALATKRKKVDDVRVASGIERYRGYAD